MATRTEKPGAAVRPTVLLLALVLLGFNLRPAVTSLGAVLSKVQTSTGMPDVVAGLLTSIPPVTFGLVGLMAKRLNARLGLRASLGAGMALLAGGLAVRAAPGGTGMVLAGTALALSGIAAANVLMPVAVKQWFPVGIGLATSAYTIALAVGNALAAGATAPLAVTLGSWRRALGLWALPALLAIALVAAIPAHSRNGPPGGTTRDGEIRNRRKARAFVIFFGMQTLAAFTIMGWLPTILSDAGLSPSAAGIYLAIVTLLGAPMALALPPLLARRGNGQHLVWFLTACMAAAYVGLLVAPAAAPAVWAVLLGTGFGAFPLALTLIGLRTTTPEGTSQLSTMTQGRGFLLAAAGPIAIGACIKSRRGGRGRWPSWYSCSFPSSLQD